MACWHFGEPQGCGEAAEATHTCTNCLLGDLFVSVSQYYVGVKSYLPIGEKFKAFRSSKIDFVHQNWYSNTHPWSVKRETDIMCFGMDEIDQSFSMTARSSG